MKKANPLIIGNWKMNPGSVDVAKSLFIDIRKGVRNFTNVEVVIVPPSLYISDLNKLSPSGRIGLGAQDVSPFVKTGAHTGEQSIGMLMSVGARYVIVGHSERRSNGETNELVAKKLKAALSLKNTVVVCVGENIRDQQGDYFSFIEQQLKAICAVVTPAQYSRLVIAYEPIWAIGTGHTATPDDVHEMQLFIKKVLSDTIGRTKVKQIRIIYGGSVNPGNAAELIAVDGISGFLVGGASLKPVDFTSIVKIVNKYAS